MKCISRLFNLILSVGTVFCLTACSSVSYDMPYDPDTVPASLGINAGGGDSQYESFASGLCVADEDILPSEDPAPSSSAEGLFDLSDCNTVIAKNINEQLAPASLTKIMTVLLALKYGNLDDTITASSNVYITESGAQTMGLKEGDRMSLRDALYGLMVYSANDCGIMVAEYISGSVDEFAALMNKTAAELGATNTHFTNPHGLSDADHYTTAYDLYLIFNEALKYDDFVKIINTTEYTCSYKDRDGNSKSYDFNSTNGYLTGKYQSPDGVTVIGGKTGTTSAAGSCLILLAYDSSQNPYISIILNDPDHEQMYSDMTAILSEIN